MVALAVEVTAGVIFRYSGYSLVWYDEVATILLAWVTFYGSALAVAQARAHGRARDRGRCCRPGARVVAAVLAQLCTHGLLRAARLGRAIRSSTILASRPARLAAAGLGGLSRCRRSRSAPLLFVVGQLLVFPEVLREARGEATRAGGAA